MTLKTKAAPQKPKLAKMQFVCNIKPDAESVHLVGDFNDWDPNAHRMIKGDHGFKATVELSPGAYEYKYIVDGEWHHDPDRECVLNPFGTKNSIVRIHGGNADIKK